MTWSQNQVSKGKTKTIENHTKGKGLDPNEGTGIGGRSAYDVANDAWHCHLSQQQTKYEVYMDGPYDSQIFGLYRSLVGPDELHNDFFEHLD